MTTSLPHRLVPVVWFTICGLAALTLASCILRDDSNADPSALVAKPTMATSVDDAPEATHPPLEPTYAAMLAEQRSPDVPALPFFRTGLSADLESLKHRQDKQHTRCKLIALNP